MATSANLNLPYPAGTDNVSAGPTDFSSIVNLLDAGTGGPVVIRVITGTLSTFTSTYQSTPTSYPLGTLFSATDADVSFLRIGTSSPVWKSIIFSAHTSPIGTIVMSALTTAPPADPDGVTRWLGCGGQAISRATYAALFANVGTLYGAGDGSTTFNLPNMSGRFPLGPGGGSFILGATGGTINHTHTVPALTVAGLPIPGLAVPSLSVPALSIPALFVNPAGIPGLTVPSTGVNAHHHTLSANGGAQIIANTFASDLAIWTGIGGPNFTAHNLLTSPSGSLGSVSATMQATALSGTTDDATSSTVATTTVGSATGSTTTNGSATGGGGTGTGTTGTGTTGGGTTGTGTTGSNNPPYIVLNWMIKAL